MSISIKESNEKKRYVALFAGGKQQNSDKPIQRRVHI
jgi:hypothetical protein